MNRFYTLLSLLLFSSILQAQTFESQDISLMSGYSHQVYFDFENGPAEILPGITSVANNNWSLAFSNPLQSSSIYLNDGKGVELYKIDGLNVADFDSIIDTANYQDRFTPMYSDYSSWESSAFEADATGHPNYGWGEYNMVTHIITGTKVYLLKTISGDFYKFMIEDRVSGVWHFRYASLDNSIDVTDSIDAADLSTKNFTYYSLANQVSLNREPDNTAWDLTFTQYLGTLSPGVYYPVVGVLANGTVEVAEARGIAPADASFDENALDEVVNEIGSDWKTFDRMSFQWVLDDSLSFFVKSQEGDIYHIYFTDFEGQSTGNLSFSYAKVQDANTSVTDRNSPFAQLVAYPNPVQEVLHVVMDPKEIVDGAQIALTNTLGQVVYQQDLNRINGLTQYEIPVRTLQTGMYRISVSTSTGLISRTIVVER